MADFDDSRLIRSLKVFVVAAGVVLVLGTGLLVYLLVARGRGGTEAATVPAGTSPPTTLALPAGARIGQVVAAGNQLVVIVGEGADGAGFLAVVDPATGRRRHLLRIVPEPAP